MERIDDAFLTYACSILADTNKGLSSSEIIKYCCMFSVRFNRPIPHTQYPFVPRLLPKARILKDNIDAFSIEEQFQILHFIVSLSKFDDFDEARSVEATMYSRYEDAEAVIQVSTIWTHAEAYFCVLQHSDDHISSLDGSREIICIFKDWVENNGGWKDIQNTKSNIRETTVRRLIFLGAKKYLYEQNLDMNCDNNIGVGEEDIKVSRGNDKTVIEIKLSSNSRCKNGLEKQIQRYSEAEHTDNMLYVLINLGDEILVEEIINLYDDKRSNGARVPELFVIDATPKKTASKL